jgi:hypothetical protein
MSEVGTSTTVQHFALYSDSSIRTFSPRQNLHLFNHPIPIQSNPPHHVHPQLHRRRKTTQRKSHPSRKNPRAKTNLPLDRNRPLATRQPLHHLRLPRPIKLVHQILALPLLPTQRVCKHLHAPHRRRSLPLHLLLPLFLASATL